MATCEEIFLFFFLPLSFLCSSFFVCCDEFFFLGRLSSSIKNQFFPTIFFLSCSFLIGKSKFQFQFCLSLFLFLSPHLKKRPAKRRARACVPRAIDRSIESRFVTSHREIQTTLLRHRRERERKKWRTFCSHRGCARVRDGTRTGNPSIRPPP